MSVLVRLPAWALATLSGLLWVAAWPELGGVSALAFVAWVPLFALEQRTLAQGTPNARLGAFTYLALFIWNVGTTYWIALVSEPLATRLFSAASAILLNTLFMCLPWWLRRKMHRAYGTTAAHLAFIATWMTFEYLHMDWDLSWTWLTIGNVFANSTDLVQWYEYTGASGGTLWVLLGNWAVWYLLCAAPQLRMRAVVLLLSLLSPALFSHVLLRADRPLGRVVEVALVQPNVDPYNDKFGGVDPAEQTDRMMRQAAGVVTDSTMLLVLPETALQENTSLSGPPEAIECKGLWENDLAASDTYAKLRAFQARHPQVAILAGMASTYLYPSDAVRGPAARPLRGTNRWYESYNAAWLVRPDGSWEPYHKSKLVPGVELMPFEEVLGSLGSLAIDLGGTTGSLATQAEREVMHTGPNGIAAAPVICYEAIYGEHVAMHVRNGADLLVMMTNDAWWSDSPGYRHLLAYSTLRCIETRRWAVRSANTGISCFIDAHGNVLERTQWWQPDARRGKVHLQNDITFFVRHGDMLSRIACAGSVCALLALGWHGIRTRIRRRTNTSTVQEN
jgi:apolipoprotein N-acyltransferase